MGEDAGHLYHDNYLAAPGSVTSGALMAREHLKARRDNARQQRLLRQHDLKLQQAKKTYEKRSQWEQEKVRQDLRTILSRSCNLTVPETRHTTVPRRDRLPAENRSALILTRASQWFPSAHTGRMSSDLSPDLPWHSPPSGQRISGPDQRTSKKLNRKQDFDLGLGKSGNRRNNTV